MIRVLLTLLLDLISAPTTPAHTLDATSLGMRGGKPPLAWHYFDIVVRNPSSAPRWMILPIAFPELGHKDLPARDEVAELQMFRLSRGAFFVKSVGGNFQALKLPAHGSITLRGLSIESWWGELPAKVDITLIIARSIKVGGTSLEKIGGEATMSPSGIAVDVPWDLGGDPKVTFWHPRNAQSAAVVIDEESRVSATIPLLTREHR